MTSRAALLDALAFQVECGVDEALSETPIDRFAAPAPPAAPAIAPTADRDGDPAAEAAAIAAGCATLGALRAAIEAFDRCPLKAGARSTVFADGDPGAAVMILGEAPGREEDRQGLPFVGRSGQLLDRMLAAIGLDRAGPPERGAYISNIVPWRPIENRAPGGDEIAMLMPFALRHVELAAPRFLVLMGATAARGVLDTSEGIMRLRGRWRRGPFGLPTLPTLHPAYLLRNPAAKRQSWRDLLSLRAALDGEPPAITD